MLNFLFRGARSRTLRRASVSQQRSFVPRLEALEDRSLPSTLTVINLADSGVGSLRGQLAAAAPGDTIDFAPNLIGTINLASDVTVDRDLTIQGRPDLAGDPLVTLNSWGRDRSIDLFVNPGVTADVSGLTFTGATGAAVRNSGTLTLSRVAVTGNPVGTLLTGPGLTYSGTLLNEGTLVVRDSRIAGNLMENGVDGYGGGGGIYSAGGVLTVQGSAVTGNEVRGPYDSGGGIYVAGGTAVITNSTISGNRL